jgi:hypothetical protein
LPPDDPHDYVAREDAVAAARVPPLGVELLGDPGRRQARLAEGDYARHQLLVITDLLQAADRPDQLMPGLHPACPHD